VFIFKRQRKLNNKKLTTIRRLLLSSLTSLKSERNGERALKECNTMCFFFFKHIVYEIFGGFFFVSLTFGRETPKIRLRFVFSLLVRMSDRTLSRSCAIHRTTPAKRGRVCRGPAVATPDE